MRILPRGLRAQSATAFAVLALWLSVTLSVGTYQLTRYYLLDQRESLATRQVTVNALVSKGIIAASRGPDEVLPSLQAISNARAVVRVGTNWYSAVVEFNEASIPTGLVAMVDARGSAQQRIELNGSPYVVTGIDLPDLDAAYFEFVSLREYQQTLETLATILSIGAAITIVGGALAGWLMSRRLMRPLAEIATTAHAISAGDLSQRLEVGRDPDLEPVADSFNEMASSLEKRINRELRFTADVSHELRTPLTAMTSAVSLAQRADLSGRAKFAVDVLTEQVDHLRRLTLELLEISRIDAGVAELRLEDTNAVAITRHALEEAGIEPDRIRSMLGEDVVHRLDRIRYERVLANLIENAGLYGGGVTAIVLERRGRDLLISVDDAGPGVASSERTAIFGRFHRGAVEHLPDRPKGTGLGLALVEEHVRMHGGSVTVTDSPDGGARFTVRLPELP